MGRGSLRSRRLTPRARCTLLPFPSMPSDADTPLRPLGLTSRQFVDASRARGRGGAPRDEYKALFREGRVPAGCDVADYPIGATLVEGETAKFVLLPASPGTGIIAGAAVRAVCESAGIRDVLSKAHGATNPVNLVKAALEALKQLRPKADVERLRGITLS